jgi:hypothetical protein
MFKQLSIIIILSLTALIANSASINLVNGKGIEKALSMVPGGKTSGFMPYSKVISTSKAGMLIFRKGKNGGFYFGMGPFKVKPTTPYKLNIAGVTLPHKVLQFKFFMYKGSPEKPSSYGSSRLVFDSVHQMQSSHELITASNVNRMTIWVAVNSSKAGYGLQAGKQAFFNKLELQELGMVEQTPETKVLYGKNLLKISNFSDQPLGKVNYNKLGLSNSKNKAYSGKIVNSLDGKVLKIGYKNGQYKFVHFTSKNAPIYGQIVRFSGEVRGEGTLKLGLWWKRKYLYFCYRNEIPVVLMPEWQKVSVEYGCTEPLTYAAAGSFSLTGEKVDIEIKNVKIEIVAPFGN